MPVVMCVLGHVLCCYCCAVPGITIKSNEIKSQAKCTDTDRQSQLCVKVYNSIAVLRHVSAYVKKPSSCELKTPKEDYHVHHIKHSHHNRHLDFTVL